MFTLSNLQWLLLACTISVRVLVAQHKHQGFYLDLLTIPFWLTFYAAVGAYKLMVIPFLFGYLDLRAVMHWWKR